MATSPYSYYLVHAYLVLALLRPLLALTHGQNVDVLFWICLVPVFALSYCAGAALFLLVEKPYSLGAQARAAPGSVAWLRDRWIRFPSPARGRVKTSELIYSDATPILSGIEEDSPDAYRIHNHTLETS